MMYTNEGIRKKQGKGAEKTLILLLSSVVIFLVSACASTPKLPPPPSRYVNNPSEDIKSPLSGSNSLWHDRAALYEDTIARRLNDLVTINLVENDSASGTANTSTTKQSSTVGAVTSLFGIPTNLNLPNLFGQGNTFSPTVNGSMNDSFAGTGATNRAGTVVGTITAKVVEVMPNGNLMIESRKEITINNEKQTLILQGMVRPEDLAIDNSVMSTRVADAHVFYVGDGIIQSKQDTGWLDKIIDKIWPF